MTVHYFDGDLFTSQADVLGHGVNVKGAMASGIALQFASRFPEMEEEYNKLCARSLLTPGHVYMWPPDIQEGNTQWVFNLATQVNPGPDASIFLIRHSLEEALHYMEVLDLKSIALPRIGSGVGGLDWAEVEEAILDIAEQFPEIRIEIWTIQ